MILLIATRNLHKVDEIRAILGEEIKYCTMADYPCAPEVVEDAPTFAGNATKKAVALAKWVAGQSRADSGVGMDDMFVLADDSGLEVDALGGAPGVHSARFAALDTGAKGNSSTEQNNEKLLKLLRNVAPEKRTARFHCVIALAPVLRGQHRNASPVCEADECEMQVQLFEGTCEGRIIFEPRGRGGFGYDPLFVPNGYEQTFGELRQEVKNKLSHRAQALEKLRRKIQVTHTTDEHA